MTWRLVFSSPLHGGGGSGKQRTISGGSTGGGSSAGGGSQQSQPSDADVVRLAADSASQPQASSLTSSSPSYQPAASAAAPRTRSPGVLGSTWGQARTVEIDRQANESLGISIVGTYVIGTIAHRVTTRCRSLPL